MASTQKLKFLIIIPTHVAMIFPYLSQLDQKTSHVVLEICMWFPKQHDLLSKPRNLFSTFTLCGFETTCWALCGVETTRVCGFEICLFLVSTYLTGQLELILKKFELAGVVLVVLKPHVFNLTGQLASKRVSRKIKSVICLSADLSCFWFGGKTRQTNRFGHVDI